MKRIGMLAGAAMAVILAGPAAAQQFDQQVFAAAEQIQPKVVAWRRDIHANPELGNRETRTAKLVADHLRKHGIEVRTGVAHTGVVGVLKGGKPGPVVALRADMDALPVEEKTGLPFASKVRTTYNGQDVGVMHACGHDAHVAILMGAAEILAGMREEIPGTIVFLFQPAEEGAPEGEKGGASLMVAEGALKNPVPDAVFGLHVMPGDVGAITWRPGPMMAGSDKFEIRLKGKQTHGAQPWNGIDMVSVGADIVTAFNQIAARQMNVARAPTVLTIATAHAGVRYNIIPEEMTLSGTLRTFESDMRTDIIARMEKAVATITDRYGAAGEIIFGDQPNPVVDNNRDLTVRMEPTLTRAAGGKVNNAQELITGAEDFSYYQKEVPGLFYRLGIGFPPGTNHSPFFTIEESAMEVGVRAQVLTALDFLSAGAPAD